MAVETSLRRMSASAQKAVYRVLGSTIQYGNRGAAAVTLYADQDEETKSISPEIEIEIELSRRVFFVPYQTNFPPTNGVSIGDEITWSGAIYCISENGIKQDAIGSSWELTCERKQARRII